MVEHIWLGVEDNLQGALIPGEIWNQHFHVDAGILFAQGADCCSELARSEIVEVISVDVANGMNSTSTMGVGEPPFIPTAGAIANAVANACGARVRSLPITPWRVLEALGEV